VGICSVRQSSYLWPKSNQMVGPGSRPGHSVNLGPGSGPGPNHLICLVPNIFGLVYRANPQTKPTFVEPSFNNSRAIRHNVIQCKQVQASI